MRWSDRRRRRGFTAIVFGLGLAVSPVLAAPASETAKSADVSDIPTKKAGHGGSVAFWVAIGVAVFVAVQSARGRKTDIDKDEK